MSYCTKDDILTQLDEAILIQLTDDDNSGAVNDDFVTRAIADADAEIDAYVGARHAVPLDPVPALIRAMSTVIAVYNLYSRRLGPPDHIKDRYQAAVGLLELIAKGTASLGASDPEGSPPTANAPEMADTNPRRIFSRNRMRGF